MNYIRCAGSIIQPIQHQSQKLWKGQISGHSGKWCKALRMVSRTAWTGCGPSANVKDLSDLTKCCLRDVGCWVVSPCQAKNPTGHTCPHTQRSCTVEMSLFRTAHCFHEKPNEMSLSCGKHLGEVNCFHLVQETNQAPEERDQGWRSCIFAKAIVYKDLQSVSKISK